MNWGIRMSRAIAAKLGGLYVAEEHGPRSRLSGVAAGRSTAFAER